MTLALRLREYKLSANSGFSLIELVAVLIIIGTLAALSAPRLFNNQVFYAEGFRTQAEYMVRFAQKVAVAQNRNVFVRLNSNSVALCFTQFNANSDCTPAHRVIPPAGKNSGSAATLSVCGTSDADRSWFCEASTLGVEVQTAPAASLFYFNALGKPYIASTSEELSQLQIMVIGGGVTHEIYVERETGYVHH